MPEKIGFNTGTLGVTNIGAFPTDEPHSSSIV